MGWHKRKIFLIGSDAKGDCVAYLSEQGHRELPMTFRRYCMLEHDDVGSSRCRCQMVDLTYVEALLGFMFCTARFYEEGFIWSECTIFPSLVLLWVVVLRGKYFLSR